MLHLAYKMGQIRRCGSCPLAVSAAASSASSVASTSPPRPQASLPPTRYQQKRHGRHNRQLHYTYDLITNNKDAY